MSSGTTPSERFLDKIKTCAKRFVVNTVVVFIIIGLFAWLFRFFNDQTELLLDGIHWFIASTHPLFAVFFLGVLGVATVYLLGTYSLTKLGTRLFTPSKKRKIFFTIKMESPFHRKGYCHGYITRIEQREAETLHTAWIIFGGFSPITELKEGDFIRTDLTVLQILSLYLSGDAN
ncbi:MAG: hypothetical protein Q8R36_02050 [bacterium]|nr:hypothetical protein [bacterium]